MSELNPLSRKMQRWERRKKARPQELLTAALDLFVEHGFAATHMEDVAKRAGVAKGTLYLYFSSKDELFKAVVRENTLPILGDIESVMDNFEGDSVSLLKIYHDEVILRCNEIVGRLLCRGVERGEFRKIDTQYMTEVIVAPMIMLLIWEHPFGVDQVESISPKTYLSNFIDLCVHGLLRPKGE